jgi:hypothetical protein
MAKIIKTIIFFILATILMIGITISLVYKDYYNVLLILSSVGLIVFGQYVKKRIKST